MENFKKLNFSKGLITITTNFILTFNNGNDFPYKNQNL